MVYFSLYLSFKHILTTVLQKNIKQHLITHAIAKQNSFHCINLPVTLIFLFDCKAICKSNHSNT